MKPTQKTIAGYFRGKNVITPEAIEYGRVYGRIFYELSTGEIFGKNLFGVTLRKVEYGRPIEALLDESQCFDSEAEARQYIKLLRRNEIGKAKFPARRTA